LRKEQIYDEIVNKILTFKLIPGQVINAAEIAKEIGVSITPVREVFIRLEIEKLIEVRPQSSTSISLIDLNFVQQVVYMRHVLERDITFTLCELLRGKIPAEVEKNFNRQREAIEEGDIESFILYDNDFHRMLFRLCGHEAVWDIIERSKLHYVRLRYLDTSQPNALERIYKQHVSIIEDVRESNKSALDELLREHHFFDLESHNSLLEKYPDYFEKQPGGSPLVGLPKVR